MRRTSVWREKPNSGSEKEDAKASSFFGEILQNMDTKNLQTLLENNIKNV